MARRATVAPVGDRGMLDAPTTSRGIVSASVDGPPGAAPPSPPGFPPDTFRANLYAHHADGHVEWYALLPASFARGPLVIGRDPDCAINIDDGATSGRHARIDARGPALWLTDLDSTNGTLLEESRLRPGRPIRLEDGAVIGIGNADIRFLYSRRDNPIRLVAEFVEGPLAGTRRVTAGPSTTIGRLAELKLDGPGIAGNHLRVDAYDAEHIYVVPLDPSGRTAVFGAPLHGIATLSGGAELTIGPHRFRLRVEVAPEPSPISPAAPPRVDAAMHEARLQGHDPRAFDDRTIMDLSPLGAMVAKVLAGEVPPPPSAVRPPVRRPTHVQAPDVSSGTTVLELSRRTGPVPALRPATPAWVRGLVALLVLVTVIAVAGLIPIQQRLHASLPLEPGPPVTVSAPVKGVLLSTPAAVGQTVRRGQPLVRLADEAIAAEIDRLSHRIGALEIYAGDGRIRRRNVEAAGRAVAEAEAELARRQAPGADFDGDALLEARRVLHEHRGKLEALEARLSDADAGPADAAAEIGRLVHRRASLAGRLVITLDAPVRGRVESAPRPDPGAAMDVGRLLYRLVPLDPLHVLVDPAAVDARWMTEPGYPSIVSVGGHRIDVVLRTGDGGVYRGVVPSPAGQPAPGAAVTVEVRGPSRSALLWVLDRAGIGRR